MITPAEFLAASAANILNPKHLEQIRKHFDDAIKSAQRARATAVAVPVSRADWTPAEVQAVVDEYAAAGWVVATGHPRYLAQLSAP